MHGSPMTYNQWMQQMRHNEQTGRGVVFAIDYHEHIVGQISLGAIDLGSMRTGVIGYWVDQRYAGQWGAIMRACGPGTCSSTGSGAIMRPTACSPRTPATGSSIV